MESCNTILDTLRSQLAQSFLIRSDDGGCLIETPFSYPDRRMLTVYVSPLASGDFELSDDGYAHSYARVSGVSKDVLTRTASELENRYNVEAGHGEVVATTSPESVLHGLIALIEASQGIADTVARKRAGETTNRLDRQIARTLVLHDRTYERKAKVPVGSREIDVDYSVLPTERLQQLNLFSVSSKVGLRTAESIAYRVEQIQKGDPTPGFSNRILLISDESSAFRDATNWKRVRGTLRDTGAKVVPITETREIERWLTA